jgi:prophage DNA circulation protein
MEEIAWVKQLRQASWRDVPFQVDTVDITAGENTVLREYPFQDLPTVFSMGPAAEEIKFSAYVIGDDYLDKLEALRAVLKGDGILVHPTQASIRCYQHGKYTIKEAPTKEGGIARLDLTFIRGEERRYPVGKVNSAEQLAANSAATKQSVTEKFVTSFNTSGSPGWSLDNLRTGMRGAFETVWSSVSAVQKEMDYVDNLVVQFITSPTNELFGLKDTIGNMVSSIMKTPENIATSDASYMFGSLRSLWSDKPSSSVASSYQSSGISTSAASGTRLTAALQSASSPYRTETRQKEADAFQSLTDLFEGMATISAAEAVAQIELDNYDQALALRQDFNAQFGKMLRRGVADHELLMRLHTAVLADLQQRSQDLARITTYTPQTWQPVLYISYRLFGTVQWADEIMAMNPHIRNPLLVPPGKPLRIVKRD